MSISFIISKTHFSHCFLFLHGILFLFHSFSKTFLQKLSLPFFNNLENQTTFILFLVNSKGSIPKSLHTASLQVFEEQHKIFLHAANSTASNALDWDIVHLHTSLPYSNDGQRMDKITCLLTYKLKPVSNDCFFFFYFNWKEQGEGYIYYIFQYLFCAWNTRLQYFHLLEVFFFYGMDIIIISEKCHQLDIQFIHIL